MKPDELKNLREKLKGVCLVPKKEALERDGWLTSDHNRPDICACEVKKLLDYMEEKKWMHGAEILKLTAELALERKSRQRLREFVATKEHDLKSKLTLERKARIRLEEGLEKIDELGNFTVENDGGVLSVNGHAIADFSELPKINEDLFNQLTRERKARERLEEEVKSWCWCEQDQPPCKLCVALAESQEILSGGKKCKGIDLGDGNFSGCDLTKKRDCPVCCSTAPQPDRSEG